MHGALAPHARVQTLRTHATSLGISVVSVPHAATWQPWAFSQGRRGRMCCGSSHSMRKLQLLPTEFLGGVCTNLRGVRLVSRVGVESAHAASDSVADFFEAAFSCTFR